MNAPASYVHPHIPTVGKSTKDVPVPVQINGHMRLNYWWSDIHGVVASTTS